MTKLNWDRADRETYDAGLDVSWRRGPREPSFEFPDHSVKIDLTLHSAPNIYWAKSLGDVFWNDDAEGHVRLFDAAWRAAASVYYNNGWTVARNRMLALYQRASGLYPYPSLFFAVYFDYCLLNAAKWDHKNRGVALPKIIASYDVGFNGSIYSRAWAKDRKFVDRLGKLDGFYNYLRDIRQKVIDKRSRAG